MITAQIESFEERLPEMEPLLPLHWEELALFKDKMPLDPDYGHYVNLERQGQLLFATIREAGALVGYFVGAIGGSPHYRSTLTCKMDVIYLHPDHRGRRSGILLMDTVKSELKRRGVKLWWMGSKVHLPIAPLLDACGFELAETYHTLWIGDDDGS